ncbi:hypothetical protein E2C01_049114 [Portunus trituberculatus]|uniref:Uncharacterized protein n=1 Tax=Portunus trituberculatus TaxID=210409 RepID=A0A5B7GD25_PORTR|nr:hypothetical protein [Portunus trituberculatus]
MHQQNNVQGSSTMRPTEWPAPPPVCAPPHHRTTSMKVLRFCGAETWRGSDSFLAS